MIEGIFERLNYIPMTGSAFKEIGGKKYSCLRNALLAEKYGQGRGGSLYFTDEEFKEFEAGWEGFEGTDINHPDFLEGQRLRSIYNPISRREIS